MQSDLTHHQGLLSQALPLCLSREDQTMENLENIKPVKPVAPYIGGKIKLAKTIIEIINETKHTGYADVFCGMGGIFFRRDLKPKTEVINDINNDVANLFRILQRHYPQFMDTLKYQLTSRHEFERLKKTDPTTLTDLERAARFIYMQKTNFGGKVAGQNYGVKNTGGGRFNLSNIAPILDDAYERLHGVHIESLPWQTLIEKYDREGMLFYLDPPYWDCENDYGKNVFSKDDFKAMAKTLQSIEGKFIMSINDVPQIRSLFKSFDKREVSLNYSIGGGKGAKANELIICG